MIGCGATAIATQYYIFKETHDSNAIILKKQMDVESRLKALEGKK